MRELTVLLKQFPSWVSSRWLLALPNLTRCSYCLPCDPLSSQAPPGRAAGPLSLDPLCTLSPWESSSSPRVLPTLTRSLSHLRLLLETPTPMLPNAYQAFLLRGHILNKACSSPGFFTAIKGMAIHPAGNHS